MKMKYFSSNTRHAGQLQSTLTTFKDSIIYYKKANFWALFFPSFTLCGVF